MPIYREFNFFVLVIWGEIKNSFISSCEDYIFAHLHSSYFGILAHSQFNISLAVVEARRAVTLAIIWTHKTGREGGGGKNERGNGQTGREADGQTLYLGKTGIHLKWSAKQSNTCTNHNKNKTFQTFCFMQYLE